MKLEISVNVEREFSKRASTALSFLANVSDPKIIADYLNATFSGNLDYVSLVVCCFGCSLLDCLSR